MYGGSSSPRRDQPNAKRNQSNSYQHAGTYQPPAVSGSYAQQQTQITEDSLRTQYEAEATANTVLSQMTTQRYQLQNAHDQVTGMKETTEMAKRELADLASKTLKKKRRLQLIVAALGTLDFLLLVRLFYCGGSFFCRRHY
eukprot:CAMPEP_0172501516 /NCGR_PEP_ID=MMETSP1066-20121228/150598_1 /TAXON_ID=671091 /ORGANISM="Coscinodiscus wailesii, Strain CCMP2513" /LENGTH=140 /DNA_ID=CAMNT_0013276327 /DNA_START=162 /DNA_END=584 /DNA_ORIENTATION=+